MQAPLFASLPKPACVLTTLYSNYDSLLYCSYPTGKVCLLLLEISATGSHSLPPGYHRSINQAIDRFAKNSETCNLFLEAWTSSGTPQLGRLYYHHGISVLDLRLARAAQADRQALLAGRYERVRCDARSRSETFHPAMSRARASSERRATAVATTPGWSNHCRFDGCAAQYASSVTWSSKSTNAGETSGAAAASTGSSSGEGREQ